MHSTHFASPSACRRLRRVASILLLGFAVQSPAFAQAPAQPAAHCPPVAQAPDPAKIPELMQKARDRGMLWRITKGEHSSYLYGTLHVGKLDWLFPGPRTAQALRETDIWALELDPTDMATLERMNAYMAKQPAPKLPDALSARLAKQRAAACVDEATFGSLHPVMQTMVLQILSARAEGLDPAYAQESFLAGMARGMQRPLVALETPEHQLDFVFPKNSADQLEMIDSGLKQLENGKARPLVQRLSEVWAGGDLARIENYEQWCDCVSSDKERAYLQRLNDGRNPQLAERIDALHAEGKKVFAAVGALHMSGAKALPKLLAERGYKVERIEFKP